MRRSLSDLSDELQLKIIDVLLEHDESLYKQSELSNKDDNFKCHRDLMNWSCTSLYFRNLLAPYIFRVVKLRNDEQSGNSIEYLSNSTHGTLVRGVNFIGTVPEEAVEIHNHTSKSGGSEDEDDGEEKFNIGEGEPKEDNKSIDDDLTDVIMPKAVARILSNLHRFPKLVSLSIGFTYPLESCFTEYYGEDFPGADDMEDDERTLRDLWRMMMNKVYSLVSHQNTHPPFQALEIRNLVWTHTYPFEKSDFHKLLAHMQAFTLSISGGENGAGWQVNTIEKYADCVGNFDSMFFDHLHSASSVTLKATHDGPIGLEGNNHAPLGLEPSSMPKLRHLYLEEVFLCDEIIELLRTHAETFEQLRLFNCFAAKTFDAVNPVPWNEFFDELHDANMKNFKQLEVEFFDPRSREDDDVDDEEEAKEDTEPQKAVETSRTDGKRREFTYVTVDDKYGMIFDIDGDSLKPSQREEDQKAFDRLQRMIDENVSRGKVMIAGG